MSGRRASMLAMGRALIARPTTCCCWTSSIEALRQGFIFFFSGSSASTSRRGDTNRTTILRWSRHANFALGGLRTGPTCSDLGAIT